MKRLIPNHSAFTVPLPQGGEEGFSWRAHRRRRSASVPRPVLFRVSNDHQPKPFPFRKATLNPKPFRKATLRPRPNYRELMHILQVLSIIPPPPPPSRSLRYSTAAAAGIPWSRQPPHHLCLRPPVQLILRQCPWR